MCIIIINWKYYNEILLKDIYIIILIIKGECFWGVCLILVFIKIKEKYEFVKWICYCLVFKFIRCCELIGLIYKLWLNYDFY